METRDIIEHVRLLLSLGVFSKTFSWGGEEILDIAKICYDELITSGFIEVDVTLEDGEKVKLFIPLTERKSTMRSQGPRGGIRML